jgi:hypothetical protein
MESYAALIVVASGADVTDLDNKLPNVHNLTFGRGYGTSRGYIIASCRI